MRPETQASTSDTAVDTAVRPHHWSELLVVRGLQGRLQRGAAALLPPDHHRRLQPVSSSAALVWPVPRSGPVRKVFERVFREFGMPEAIRSDNGSPFASNAPRGLSQLSVWWAKLGIRHERITPGKPQGRTDATSGCT